MEIVTNDVKYNTRLNNQNETFQWNRERKKDNIFLKICNIIIIRKQVQEIQSTT